MRLLTAMMGTRDALKTYPSPRLPFTLRVPAPTLLQELWAQRIYAQGQCSKNCLGCPTMLYGRGCLSSALCAHSSFALSTVDVLKNARQGMAASSESS